MCKHFPLVICQCCTAPAALAAINTFLVRVETPACVWGDLCYVNMYVNMNVYFHFHFHFNMYVCLFVYFYFCFYLYVNIYVYLFVYFHIFMYGYVFVCVCIITLMFVSLSLISCSILHRISLHCSYYYREYYVHSLGYFVLHNFLQSYLQVTVISRQFM